MQHLRNFWVDFFSELGYNSYNRNLKRNNMNTYVVIGSCGYCGTEYTEILGEYENADSKEIWEDAKMVAAQTAESYGVVFEEDYDETASDEDIEDDAMNGMVLGSVDDLDYHIELYNKEKHGV